MNKHLIDIYIYGFKYYFKFFFIVLNLQYKCKQNDINNELNISMVTFKLILLLLLCINILNKFLATILYLYYKPNFLFLLFLKFS